MEVYAAIQKRRSNMNITTLGIDIAKNVFQLHGVDQDSKTVLTKRLSRAKLLEFVTNLNPCLIGMESCGGSNYWTRKFIAAGHIVKLMSPQFVKPYVKSNKNDKNDAEAICEAVARPNMRFVCVKQIEQQDIQSIHRIRTRLVAERTALANQIRGLLAEYGIVIPKNIGNIRSNLPEILEDGANELSGIGRETFKDLYDELVDKDKKILAYDKKIKLICNQNAKCKKLTEISGIGPITATAILAAVGDARVFKNGREMAAWLGLVPKQCSSGGKERLLGISKRGDKYLRSLLIHGARAVIFKHKNKDDTKSKWAKQLVERRGINKAVVAVANKNARIIWAKLTGAQPWQAAA
jgi:transposase